MITEDELKKFQEAYLEQNSQLSRATDALKRQNEDMEQAIEMLNQRDDAIEQLKSSIQALQAELQSINVLITAMVHSAGGEIIVRIDDYNDALNGKHILSRREGVKKGDAVFTTRELPLSPLWLTKDILEH
jgi:uncharacterized FlaG/YvyC family protein